MDRNALARKHLERRLAPLREAEFAAPPRGWLRAIREAIGMTARQMAKRLGVVPSRIVALEQSEVRGSVTLKTLRDAAAAMDCMLIYAIVPREPLDALLRARAAARADEELARIDHSMRLENQAVAGTELMAERERMIDELLRGSLRRLWDEP